MLALAILATALGACALVEGLSQYSKEDCSRGCGDDGGFDAAEPTPDSGTTPDGADAGLLRIADASDGEAGALTRDGGEGGLTPDSGEGGLTPDSGEGGLTPDSGSTVGDSGADTGACGPLTSVDNCGACGVQCNMTTGTPSCTSAACTYVCTAGRSDCNTAAPDTDGCECATPGCCGSACQTSHADGVGQSYFDCNPPGTYTEMSAFSACTAYALSVGSNAANCVGPLTCRGSPVPTVCFTTSSGSCASYCWQYSGVYADGGPGTVWDCACPAHMVGGWN